MSDTEPAAGTADTDPTEPAAAAHQGASEPADESTTDAAAAEPSSQAATKWQGTAS